MEFGQELIEGRLLRRYKRFLADVELPGGEVITAHTPNTGSMRGCAEPGSRVWLSRAANPRRKYPYSWGLVEVAPGTLVGIDTGLPGRLVREAIDTGVVEALQGYHTVRPEVHYGREGSRIDLLLEGGGRPCYLEIKNVTLVEGETALFPDAVTARGTRHLRELMGVAGAGQRAVIFFCIQRDDVQELRPADAIDPEYGRTLRAALAAGVEALAYAARVSTRGVTLYRPVPVVVE